MLTRYCNWSTGTTAMTGAMSFVVSEHNTVVQQGDSAMTHKDASAITAVSKLYAAYWGHLRAEKGSRKPN